jgi:predicted  nucleic acid-binding Zn-ribbon protein
LIASPSLRRRRPKLPQIETLNQGVQTRDTSIADLRSQALEFLRQREGLENRVKQLEDAAETREQKFAAESERLSRLLQNDRDRYNASLKEEQDRSALERSADEAD